MEPVSLSSAFGMSSNAYPKTHENTSKAHFQPKKSTSKGKIKFFAKELAKSPPFRNQTASLQSIR